MAKFDAGTAVESLEYDFTKFGGGSGEITEPSTAAVNIFFKNMRSLMGEVKGLQAEAEALSKVEDMSDEEMLKQVDKMEEATEGASKYQTRTMEMIAELCGAKWEPEDAKPEDKVLVGGSPSFEDLQKLPFRHLQAFNKWLIEQIQPKRATPGSKN